MGCGMSGTSTNQLDIFPEYAGIILGLSNAGKKILFLNYGELDYSRNFAWSDLPIIDWMDTWFRPD